MFVKKTKPAKTFPAHTHGSSEAGFLAAAFFFLGAASATSGGGASSERRFLGASSGSPCSFFTPPPRFTCEEKQGKTEIKKPPSPS